MADDPAAGRRGGEAVTEADRRDWRAWAQARAASAWSAGTIRLAAGDLSGAARLLGRAARLASTDGNVALLLASVLLRQGRVDEAGRRFEAVAQAHDVAEAWLGLAACRLAQADPAGAATAWARVASRCAADDSLLSLGERLADAAAPGWIALGSDGVVHLGLASDAGQKSILRLDGVVVTGRDGSRRLPAGWQAGRELEAHRGGRPLLGSPIDIASVLRVDGFVDTHDGGLDGWLWHPHDPGRQPDLIITPLAGGAALRLTASQGVGEEGVAGQPPLARLQRFSVAAASLPAGPLRVTGSDGRDLLGSPLDPGRESRNAGRIAAAIAGANGAAGAGGATDAPLFADLPPASPPLAAPVAVRARRGVDIVIPVFRDLARTEACLEQVLATRPAASRVHVVDDASPEPAVVALLDRLAARRLVVLHRHKRNRGFPSAANTGLAACARRDAILLNADTLVASGWVEALREAAHAAPDIGSATPLSNDATILSYPARDRVNPVPDLAATRRLAALARAAATAAVIDIPTMHGFCVYLRRDCLDQVGGFREDVFAQGYGEENDLSLRARHLGWRHVAAPGVFVGHVGGASFGAGRTSLISRNLAILNRLHPGYDALIAAHVAADPLADTRRRMDVARFRQGRRQGAPPAVLLVTHDQGGGVERMVAARVRAVEATGARAIVLRPSAAPGEPFGVVVDDGAGAAEEPPLSGDQALGHLGATQTGPGRAASVAPAGGRFPNLRYRLPEEMPALARLLAGERPERAELHHLLGHEHALLGLFATLGIPYDVYLHDYAWFCPRIALIGPERRYCGEPSLDGCEACIADAGSNLDEPIGVRALVDRSQADLSGARRLMVPTADAARRMARHFTGLRPVVQGWEDDSRWPAPAPLALDPPLRVAILGGIGIEKGYDVLLGCARDAKARALPIEFTVIGHTVDDDRLMAAGPVFVTGAYRGPELAGLIAAERPALVFLPSIWPETWSYTLSHAWAAGATVVCFDIGAMAERIRARGHGYLLPLGLPASGVNAALLRIAGEAAEAYGTLQVDDIGAASRGRVAGRDGPQPALRQPVQPMPPASAVASPAIRGTSRLPRPSASHAPPGASNPSRAGARDTKRK